LLNTIYIENFYSKNKGGYFPTSYTNNPELGIAHRSQTRDQQLNWPTYQLNNSDKARNAEIQRFYQVILTIIRFNVQYYYLN
jgi:hypothetical protein